MVFPVFQDAPQEASAETISKDFRFHWIDYIVFSLMLILSAVTGVYYGYFKRKKSTDEPVIHSNGTIHSEINGNGNVKPIDPEQGSKSLADYLLGSRELKIFPVAMSLVASYISGLTILGTPSEIYNYGTQYWMIVVPIFLVGATVSYVFLPVFSALQVGSSYEYLQLRFNNKIRSISSILFVIAQILYLPIVVYVPALAFNQVSGVDIHLIGAVISFVCVFYTIIGGIRAVVATDAWQVVVMFLSVVVVAILGTMTVGGVQEVFNRAEEGKRLIFFDMTLSPYKRQTFLAVLIGGFLQFLSFNSVNQTMVQRYMSLPNMKSARISILIYIVGTGLFVSLCCYTGLLVYAAYYQCDPKTVGIVKADDQLMPLYVMQTIGEFHGVPGLFIAGVCGAALSSLSVILNSTAFILYTDILKGIFKLHPSEKVATFFIKGSILVLGAVSVGGVYIVEQLGGILGAGTALAAIGGGTTFGLFFLGMLVPWANSTGALIGAICGASITGVIAFGSQAMAAAGKLASQRLPISVENCPPNYNTTLPESPIVDESDVFPLYRLSFHWMNPIGVLTVVVVGTIVSLIFNRHQLKTLDPQLISPVIHKFLPKECFNNYGKTAKERSIL